MLKRIIWILVLVAIGGGLWALSKTRAIPVDVATVGRGPVQLAIEEEGRTRVVDRFVVSAPVGGRLLRVGLEAGDAVEKGDLVARIDPLPLKSLVAETQARIGSLRKRIEGVSTKKPKAEEIEQALNLEQQAIEALAVAENELDRAQAVHERAVKDLDRMQALARQRRVPGAELDAAVADEAQAREQVEAQEVRLKIASLAIGGSKLGKAILEARMHDYDWEEKDYEQQIAALEASLQKLQDDLQHTEIHAPVKGTVLRLLKESEQVVLAGTPILEVGDVGSLEVEVDFLSEDVAHMRKDMKVVILGRALGERTIEGRILRIHPSAFMKISSLGVEQQRVKVIVALDARDTGLGDLFRVEVRVILDERAEATLVPEGALFRVDGGPHVFAVVEGRARLRPVRTGLRGGRVREVLDGLEPGDRVILHPDDSIQEGARVEALGGGTR